MLQHKFYTYPFIERFGKDAQGISCLQPRILQAVSPGNPLNGLFGWLRFSTSIWSATCLTTLFITSGGTEPGFLHSFKVWSIFFPNLLGSSKSVGKSTGLYKHVLEFTACFGPPSPRTVSEQQRDHIERDLKLELKFPLETL